MRLVPENYPVWMALSALIGVIAAASLAALLLGCLVQRLADHRAARHYPDLDPYYAAVLADSLGSGDLAGPATAALLRAGLITIDDEGMVGRGVAGGPELQHRLRRLATAAKPRPGLRGPGRWQTVGLALDVMRRSRRRWCQLAPGVWPGATAAWTTKAAAPMLAASRGWADNSTRTGWRRREWAVRSRWARRRRA
jgi:hypothetical protein